MNQAFTTTVQKAGGRVLITMPFDPQVTWGVKPRHHVRGTINNATIRGALEADNERYFLSLGAAWRRDNGIEAGTTVNVILAPEGPQQDTLALDIGEALAQAPEAAEFFAGLATFYRKNYVRWIESTKKADTRTARIAEVIALLKAGKKQR